MKHDSVDKLLIQWSKKRAGLDTASLGVAVRIDRLASELTRDANCALEPLGLSLWEYDVLSTLRRQPPPYELPASVIARETQMSSGAITHRVSRLVERGLVQRRQSAEDRRAVLVSLTDEGLDQLKLALGARVGVVADSLTVLTNAERGTLDLLLRKWLAGSEQRTDDALSA